MSDLVLFAAVVSVTVALVVLARRYLASFAGQRAQDYLHSFPIFDLRTHLNGALICEGCIYGPFGRVTTTFNAVFMAQWDGNVGTIDEVFEYSDGTTQIRQWVITLGDDGAFTALADDVPGIGKGTQSGNAVLFRYPIQMPKDAGGVKLSAFDCMYLTPNGTVINRSEFRKFGIKLAELVATIRKETPQ